MERRVADLLHLRFNSQHLGVGPAPWLELRVLQHVLLGQLREEQEHKYDRQSGVGLKC